MNIIYLSVYQHVLTAHLDCPVLNMMHLHLKFINKIMYRKTNA